MSRKPKKGYYVRGEFVAEGSELDLAYKRELKGSDSASKTELKQESAQRQKLGAELMELRADLREQLLFKGHLNEALIEALAQAKKITDFEGKRRQLQYVGKLMRKLSPPDILALQEALLLQHGGSAKETQALHLAESWRDRLIGQDAALDQWMIEHPNSDAQALRSLIRQAQKDAVSLSARELSEGKAPRQSRAYREIFQWIRQALKDSEENEPQEEESPYPEH